MTDQYERRRKVWLTEEQLEEVAQRAAEKAVTKFYADVGRNTVKGALWLLGTIVIAALAYLGIKRG